jgi:hypothetical protein
MYLRVTRGRLDPAKSDEAARLVPAIVAAMQQLPGCQGVHVGVDRATGKSIAVSSFETQEQAQFPRERLSDALAPLMAIGWQAEAPEIYEQTQEAARPFGLPPAEGALPIAWSGNGGSPSIKRGQYHQRSLIQTAMRHSASIVAMWRSAPAR